ncbi:hypothetical protein ACFY7C_35370 [Streptomyces sp. NPDC012769]|uniref:hypothetical protein n=1 Tax=Streptomyces sp. NPDC012769 TaxID=3364848 RepID=UPI003687F697
MGMKLVRTTSREEAIALATLDHRRIGEAEQDEVLEALERGLACPRLSDYVF